MFLEIDTKNSESVAIIDDANNVVTYGELAHEMASLADMKLPRAVAFCMCENDAGTLAGYLAMVNAGIVPLMLSAKLDRELLSALDEEYLPSYYWVSEDCAHEFGTKVLFSFCGHSLISTGRDAYELNESLELLMTTSGSTGSSKLVRYKKGNLEANAINVAHAFGWTEKERGICDLPFHYTMGLNVANSHFAAGAIVLAVSMNLMDPKFWDFIREQRGTNICGVPYSYEIMRRIRVDTMDLPDLVTFAQGGGKLTDKLFAWFAEYCDSAGKRFIATFGTTETSARMSMLPANLAISKRGSIGRAIPPGEMYLMDARENEVGEAEGELCFRGPGVTMGYAVCRSDLIRGDEFGGVYRTGDLARVDTEGCYYVIGRMGRFLKLFGMRVGLDECELMVKTRFGCDCVCAGDDRRMVVYVDDAEVAGQVVSFISEKTKIHKSAFKSVLVDEIPRNEYGKVKLHDLVSQ